MSLKITMEWVLDPGFQIDTFRRLMEAGAELGGADMGTAPKRAPEVAPKAAIGPVGKFEDSFSHVDAPEDDALDTGPETAEEQMAADAAEEAARTEPVVPARRRTRRTKQETEADEAAATRRTLEAAAAAQLVAPAAPPTPIQPTQSAPMQVAEQPVVAVPPAVIAPQPTVAAQPIATVAPAAVTTPLPAIAVPPGATTSPAATVTQPVAVPPTPAIVPQQPSMPAAPPTGGPLTVADIREAIRQANMTHPGVPFGVQKANKWWTPEAIPATEYDRFLTELQAAMAATPAASS